MKYKHLALSMTMFGCVGCTSHPVISQSNTALNDKIYRSYEQLISKQSYAFDGKMTFQVQPTKQTISQTVPQKSRQQQLLDELFIQQKNINTQQKQWMKDGVDQKNSTAYAKNPNKFEQLLESFLNRYYYSFDGVVDLKHGQISMNPKIGYAAKNAQGWIAVPLALDLKTLKAYADISALSPIVTDPKYDGRYVVFDFQNIAKKENLNLRPLLELMRESVLLNAALAGEKQYKKLPLTLEDKKQGASERIQYSGTYTNLIAQYILFFYLNENYFKSILSNSKLNSNLGGLNPVDLALGKTNQLDSLYDNSAKNTDSAAMYRLYDAIDEVVNTTSPELNVNNLTPKDEKTFDAAIDATCRAAADKNTDAAEIVTCIAEAKAYEASVEACGDNASCVAELEARKACFGDRKCLDSLESIFNEESTDNLLNIQNDAIAKSKYQDKTFEKFSAYKTNKLITAQRMKQIISEQPAAYQDLVDTFASEFKQLEFLGAKNYTMDLVLDAQGRLVRVEMDLTIGGLKKLGIEKLVAKTSMNIFNYGTAKVDQQGLRNAVSFQEAANENSMLNLGKLWDKYLTEDKAVKSLANNDDASSNWSRTQRYENLAENLLQQNQNFLDAYAALYRYAYILEGEEVEDDEFSFKDLNDTARWTAIYYADEFAQPLTVKEKTEYENSPEDWYYYDEYIAEAVWNAIDSQQNQYELKKTLNQLRKQDKSDAQIFSQIYLDLETKNEQRLKGSKDVKLSAEVLKYIKVLGEVAIEDIKTQKVAIEKLRQFDQKTLDQVNPTIYKQLYKLFM